MFLILFDSLIFFFQIVPVGKTNRSMHNFFIQKLLGGGAYKYTNKYKLLQNESKNQKIQCFLIWLIIWYFSIQKIWGGAHRYTYEYTQFQMNQRIKRINVLIFCILLFFSFQKFRGGDSQIHMNANSLEINQKIKRINIFYLFDYLILFIQKILRGGGTHGPLIKRFNISYFY